MIIQILKASKDEENDLIMNKTDNFPIWLGINDINTEGLFQTMSGEVLFYSNWGNAQPNNKLDQDHVIMESNSLWNDVKSDSEAYVLCVFERKCEVYVII